MSNHSWLILTAANPAQAAGYRAQLQERAEQGLIPEGWQWRVVADPGGKRVGSGGSTFVVIHEIAQAMLKHRPHAKQLHELFTDVRVLIIHSGGDSRRLRAYAAQGKIFTPLPCTTPQGHPATLFDLMFDQLRRLPCPAQGQVLAASGDALLTFDPNDADFAQPGVVGVAYPGPVERGSKHGVYVCDPQGNITDFLQKPSPQAAELHGAVDAVGRVLVDTGLLSFDPLTVERVLQTVGLKFKQGKLTVEPGILKDVLAGKAQSIDLYEQVLIALPKKRDIASYLSQVGPRSAAPSTADQAQTARLTHLYHGLHGLRFTVNVLPYCEFFHIGSNREMIGNVAALNRTAREYRFQNGCRSVLGDRASIEGGFVYNSVLPGGQLRIGAGVLLEAVHCQGKVALTGPNIVVGWPSEAGAIPALPAGWGLVCLPIGKSDWTIIVHGLDDDFKTTLDKGGTFGNQPMSKWLVDCRLKQSTLWGDDDPQPRTLWNARLWRVGSLPDVLRDTFWLCGVKKSQPATTWQRGKRMHMIEVLQQVNHQRLLEHRRELVRLWAVGSLPQRLHKQHDLSAESVLLSLHDSTDARTALTQLHQALSDDVSPLHEARLYWLAHAIGEKYPAVKKTAPALLRGDMQQAAYAAVARSVMRQIDLPGEPRPAAVLHDQVVWATTPVRLDFAGGWSDTPPICAAVGGTVVNGAISLNGQYPVQVIAKLTEDKRINLSSMDLGTRVTLAQTSDVLDYTDPSQWSALPKAALVLAGLCPQDRNQPLTRWLDQLGGGLDLTVFSAVPKGSGLGTSSILGAAILACLARVVGENVTQDQLIARTSLLEQMMTTGGGWQDQVGGIAPGIKIIRTQPGAEQLPAIHWTGFQMAQHARQRMLLYYTGQKRMARNILQRVVGRFLARDPLALRVIDELKVRAEQMKHDLDRGDVQAFAQGITHYFDLKCQLDPGTTNPPIEAVLRRVKKYLSGYVLPGAGGGGFIYMITRDEQATQQVRRLLLQNPPNSLARFFDFEFDQKGLAVTVL